MTRALNAAAASYLLPCSSPAITSAATCGLVRQHGLAHDVANGEDVRHVGAHLNVDVDEAAVGHSHACFFSGEFFAVGRAAHGLQHQVVHLRRWGGNSSYLLNPHAPRIAQDYWNPVETCISTETRWSINTRTLGAV